MILADDDHTYENYMVEKFNYFYKKAPENAYSFYVHPLSNFGVGQGADGFAINSNFLKISFSIPCIIAKVMITTCTPKATPKRGK